MTTQKIYGYKSINLCLFCYVPVLYGYCKWVLQNIYIQKCITFLWNNFPILAFKTGTSEIDKTSLNITPTVLESDIDKLKIKLNRLQRRNDNMFDDDEEEEDNTQPQIKRGNNTI